MKMPMSEIIDRYAICCIKMLRTEYDVSRERDAYLREIQPYERFSQYVDKLIELNGEIWDLETQARRGCTEELSDDKLIQVGRLAIEIREVNKRRNGVKADIVRLTKSGFEEIPINYEKVDYGKA